MSKVVQVNTVHLKNALADSVLVRNCSVGLYLLEINGYSAHFRQGGGAGSLGCAFAHPIFGS